MLKVVGPYRFSYFTAESQANLLGTDRNDFFKSFFLLPNQQEWDGLVRIAFVRKNKTLNAAFK